tara:strand:- start:239 stop:346 length:108 start_codon:yes stop_codon:yes gene_type:complete
MINMLKEMFKDLIYHPITLGIAIVFLSLLIFNWLL